MRRAGGTEGWTAMVIVIIFPPTMDATPPSWHRHRQLGTGIRRLPAAVAAGASRLRASIR